jgi:hypothetical protein
LTPILAVVFVEESMQSFFLSVFDLFYTLPKEKVTGFGQRGVERRSNSHLFVKGVDLFIESLLFFRLVFHHKFQMHSKDNLWEIRDACCITKKGVQ